MVTAELQLLLPQSAAAAVQGYAAAWLFAGALSKIGNRDGFADVVANYDILPAAWARSVSRALPFAEFVAAATLFAGSSLAANGPAILLLLLFSAAMAANLLRGRDGLECGCDLTRPSTIAWSLVFANLILAALLALSAFAPRAAPMLVDAAGTVAGIGAYLFHQTMRTLAAMPPRRHAPKAGLP